MSSVDTIICPTPRKIAELVRGESPEPLAAELSKHINSCARCSRAFVHIESLEHAALPHSESMQLQADGKTVRVPVALADNPLAFLSPPANADELGRLAHYRIFRVLGEGGMGIVLHGEDVHLNRPVALKVIKPEFGQDSEMILRFDREARAMAQIKSEHVVTIYQVGREKDTCFIAMELLDGESLDSLVERREKLAASETMRIGREIAQALAAAHSAGLIHRDIKPANVWLEGESRRVKLLDFGLARPQSIDHKLTNTGLILGTPAYMAPEQARGMPLDARTDLFSLGCLLYKMSCGVPPFYAESSLSLMLAIVQETPRPPSYHNIELPPDLDDLIMHLLEKESDNRPQSANDVVARLRNLEKEVSPTLNRESRLERGNTPKPNPIERQPIVAARPFKDATVSGSGQGAFVPRNAEHRQVTVLVCGCELFENEDYLDRFDTDERRELLTTFYRNCEHVVNELNGILIQKSEGRILACFGFPVAYEDAGARAAKAALDIFRIFEPIEANLLLAQNVCLGMWIVINTGPATVEGKDNRVSLVGQARNLATRLETLVAAGQIICTEATHKLLSNNFACTCLGQFKVKNLAEQVMLFQIHSVVATASSNRSFDSEKLTPLAGREQELSLLKGRWEQVIEGRGQVVHLIGEAGLGKSRLVHELKRHVSEALDSDKTETILAWYGSPHFRNTALDPVRAFFHRLLRFNGEEEVSVRSARLIDHLSKYGLALLDTVPLFSSLLGLPHDSRFPSLGLSPIREREETFRALGDWLRAYSKDRQLLLIVEDLQWFDSTTLELLTRILNESMYEPFFVVLTSRPEFQAPWAPLTNQTNLPLLYLTKLQVGELLRKKTGFDLQQSVVDLIYDRAGGVPLFVEEFTQLAQESGILNQVNDTRDNLKTEMLRAIPATLQDLIMARLDHIEGDREVAQFAATLGREFSYDLISTAAGPEVQALSAELTKLVQAEVLHEKGRRPRSTFVFKNPLLQEALYNTLIKSKRQQFHAVVVETLEARFSEILQVQPELLAFHCHEAGQVENAIHYWKKAGLRSKALFANTEAIGHFERGLELLATLPETPERDSIELSLLSQLGPTYQAVFGYSAPNVGHINTRARELCKKIGSLTHLFAIMWGNWTWCLVRAELDLCLELTTEMMSLAEQTNESGILMEACLARAVTLFYRGDFSTCLTLCEQAIDQFEDREKCILWCDSTGQNAAVVVRCYLSLALWHLGYPERAMRLSKEMISLAYQIGHPLTLAHGLYFRGQLLYHLGLGNDLQAIGVEEADLAKAQGFGLWHATGVFHKGAGLLLSQGELEKAVNQMEEGLASFRALSASLTLPAQLCALSRTYITYGEIIKATEMLTEGLDLARKNCDRAQEAELHRIAGELALCLDDQPTAEASFRKAIETAHNQKCIPFELRATISLARLLEKQGLRREACATLATVSSAFSEDFSSPELAAARALLEGLRSNL